MLFFAFPLKTNVLIDLKQCKMCMNHFGIKCLLCLKVIYLNRDVYNVYSVTSRYFKNTGFKNVLDYILLTLG